MAFIHTLRGHRRVSRLFAVAVLGLLAFTGTASAKEADTTSASRATCEAPLIEQPFLSFKDDRDYVLAPGGAFEDGSLAGWSLEGGAGVAAGNEPFNLRRVCRQQFARAAGRGVGDEPDDVRGPALAHDALRREPAR